MRAKWMCVALMCALLFGSLGFAYGTIVSLKKCNDEWNNRSSDCNINRAQYGSTTTEEEYYNLDHIDLVEDYDFVPIGEE